MTLYGVPAGVRTDGVVDYPISVFRNPSQHSHRALTVLQPRDSPKNRLNLILTVLADINQDKAVSGSASKVHPEAAADGEAQ